MASHVSMTINPIRDVDENRRVSCGARGKRPILER